MLSLSKIPKLRILNIGQAQLDERVLMAISQIKPLVTLELNGCTGIDQKALKHLFKLPNLVFLLLYGTDVDDKALSDLIYLPKLEKLALKRTAVTDAFLRKIENEKNLNLDLCDAPNITKPAVDRLIQAHKNRGSRPPQVDYGSVMQSQGIHL